MADASVLVAEFLRERSRAFFSESELRVVVAEEQWSEFRHELERRLAVIVQQGRIEPEQAMVIRQEIQRLINEHAIEVVPRHVYHHVETTARRRIPRDPNDWPTVALALTLNAGILVNDNDFLSGGCPTWSFATLKAELEQGQPP
ncbi:MAG TPA: PIN domain-containing protein [Thermomicrobiales bacterium]|nr:PIN domain-containing protein [Thermomicrobiales bacterium]